MLRTFSCPCPPLSLSVALALPPLSPFLEAVRSAYAVYEAACFSAGVYTHFPFLAPSQPARPTTHPTPPSPDRLRLRHLRPSSPPPAPKEIKPHLSPLIIVVTYSPRVVSPRAVRETSLARRKNPAGAEWRRAKSEREGRAEKETMRADRISSTSDFRRDAKFFPGFVERELNWKLKKKGRKNPLFSFPPSSLLSRSIYSRFLGLIRAFDSTNFTAEIARSTRSVHRFRILDSVFLARVTDSTRVSPHFESDSISIGRVLLPFFFSFPSSASFREIAN